MNKTHEHMFLIIPKGLEFTTLNPEWNVEDKETQFYVKVRLEEDAACHLTGGTYEYTILEEIKE